ncbi:MAG: RNA polymerase sigma factor [Actinomycetota bacterium]
MVTRRIAQCHSVGGLDPESVRPSLMSLALRHIPPDYQGLARDPVDLDAVYRVLAPRLRRLACGILGDSHLAEDAVQEAFRHAVRVRGILDPARPLDGWFVGATSSICKDMLRARNAHPAVLGTETEVLDGTESDPHERLLAVEGVLAIGAALGKVSERHRRVLLARVAGTRYAEIGPGESVSARAMKPLLSRARRSLRMALDQQEARLSVRAVRYPPTCGIVGSHLKRPRIHGVRAVDREELVRQKVRNPPIPLVGTYVFVDVERRLPTASNPQHGQLSARGLGGTGAARRAAGGRGWTGVTPYGGPLLHPLHDDTHPVLFESQVAEGTAVVGV